MVKFKCKAAIQCYYELLCALSMEFIKVYFIFFKGCSECYAVCSAVRLTYIRVFLKKFRVECEGEGWEEQGGRREN